MSHEPNMNMMHMNMNMNMNVHIARAAAGIVCRVSCLGAFLGVVDRVLDPPLPTTH